MAIFGFKTNKCKGQVYTTDEVDSKLNDKSNSTHIHDDRYYTETEIDDKLATYRLKGDFAIVSGTLDINSVINGSANVNYPSGFTKDNCVVVSLETRINGNSNYPNYTYGTLALSMEQNAYAGSTAAVGKSVTLDDNNMTLRVCYEGSDEDSTSWNVDYKIVLMKI